MNANLPKTDLSPPSLAKKAGQKTLILSPKSTFYPQNKGITKL
jgi:hypothetical protein